MPRRDIVLGGLLVLLVAVSYAPVRSAGFIWDDDQYVTGNRVLTEPFGLAKIWGELGATPQYYPLVFTSFWLETRLWGLDPLGYHLVNVGLHALNAVLLWRLLLLLGVPGAWWAAAIFGLHPVHVESVAWITERKNVLSASCYFLSLLAFLRFRPLNGVPRRSLVWYALALLLFVCALLSKTVTCSLPAVIVLLLWWKEGTVRRRDAWSLVPFFVLGMGLALVTVSVEKEHVGAAGPAWSLPPLERCLIAGRALWFYAGKLVWPADLTFIYPRWQIDPGQWWQYLFPAAALGLLALLWIWRAQLGRGPLVAALIFAGTLLPALGFFNTYPMLFSFVADHFQYLASAALIALGCGALAAQVPGWARRLMLAALLIVLGVLTYRQCQIYLDAPTLWNDTLAKNPECWLAHHNLATLFFKKGHVREAAYHTEETLRLHPEQPLAHANLVSLGLLLYQHGDMDLALRAANRALESNANNCDAYLLRAQLHEHAGRPQDAERDYLACLKVDATRAEACYHLGRLLLQQKRPSEARRRFAQAAALDPDNAVYRAGLAAAMQQAAADQPAP